MPERHEDWLRQARLDLDHARLAAGAAHLEWAVFAAQQAAEKACKALHLSLGGDAWGHDLTALLTALPAGSRAPGDLVDRARALDKHYIPSRYPNGFAQGTPRAHRPLRSGAMSSAPALRATGVKARGWLGPQIPRSAGAWILSIRWEPALPAGPAPPGWPLLPVFRPSPPGPPAPPDPPWPA